MAGRIVVAGGTGFLGRSPVYALEREGYEVVVLTRASSMASFDNGSVRAVSWTPDGTVGAWATEIDGARGVIKLAGESIAARRWTRAQKERIVDSRLRATRSVVGAIKQAADLPSVLLNGSAVGY